MAHEDKFVVDFEDVVPVKPKKEEKDEEQDGELPSKTTTPCS